MNKITANVFIGNQRRILKGRCSDIQLGCFSLETRLLALLEFEYTRTERHFTGRPFGAVYFQEEKRAFSLNISLSKLDDVEFQSRSVRQ